MEFCWQPNNFRRQFLRISACSLRRVPQARHPSLLAELRMASHSTRSLHHVARSWQAPQRRLRSFQIPVWHRELCHVLKGTANMDVGRKVDLAHAIAASIDAVLPQGFHCSADEDSITIDEVEGLWTTTLFGELVG